MRFIIFLFVLVSICKSQNYRGAELRTLEPVLYGKFEARYKPPQGDGILASFFTYNTNCCQESPWNEIDIEILGRYDQVIDFNIITQSSNIRQHHISFNPHLDFHRYGFEWTPDYVSWFIDGEEVYRQTGIHIDALQHPQKIMMNIWNPEYDDWVGVWDERVLPRFAFYDYVSYASYTPGEGNIGTDSNFTLMWQDEFEFFDSTRWEKKHNHTWGGNQALFIEDNIVFQDGNMILCLTNPTDIGFIDNTVPSALWALHDDNNLNIRFSEEITIASAEEINNYSLPNVIFTDAELMEDQRTVKLTMDTNQLDATTMGVFNIEDDNSPPNTIDWQVVWIESPEPMTNALINIAGDSIGNYLSDQVWGPSKQYGHEGGNYEIIDESFDTRSPKSLYGFTKLASEELINEFNYSHKLKYIINRFGVISGPWQFGYEDQGFVSLWVINHFLKKNMKYKGYNGTGNQSRDVIHINDVCELIFQQIKKRKRIFNITFNAGGGLNNLISLKNLSKLCNEITGNIIRFKKEKKTSLFDIPIYLTDNTKVTKYYKWKPKHTIKDIVKDIYNWSKENKTILNKLF